VSGLHSPVLGGPGDGAHARVQAPIARRALTVAGMDRLGAYRVLRLSDPDGPRPQPGQFSMLAALERWGAGEDERPYVPRAFSVARWQESGNGSEGGREAHYLLEDVGPGTHRLCELRVGEEVWALGPLGRGFAPPPAGQRAILVGGGVGIAPLAILQDQLLRRDGAAVPAVVLLGFRDGARAHGAALLQGAQIATDDGLVGHRGLVTDLLARELGEGPRAVVYACGPAPLLETVRAMCAERGVPAQLALESGMACGFGACFGCVVPTRDGYLRVCVDGPVIDAERLACIDAHAGAPE
jgi:dihydroorotate dehydrogenase electron transfer subunit